MADLQPAGHELADGMTQLAQQLSPREQAMVLLYYRGGFSFRRIAKAFGLHRSSVHRLFKQLRRSLIQTATVARPQGEHA